MNKLIAVIAFLLLFSCREENGLPVQGFLIFYKGTPYTGTKTQIRFVKNPTAANPAHKNYLMAYNPETKFYFKIDNIPTEGRVEICYPIPGDTNGCGIKDGDILVNVTQNDYNVYDWVGYVEIREKEVYVNAKTTTEAAKLVARIEIDNAVLK